MEEGNRNAEQKQSDATENEGIGTKPQKRKKKRILATGMIVAIIAMAGAGLWAWHETPGFCGTMCHDTMGSYLQTYESSDFMAHDHAESGVACLDCHEAELSTQLAELQVQISGSYRLPLAKMETSDSFCLRDGCHTREGIVSALSDYTCGGEKVNPHEITFSTNYSSTESPHEVAGETIACATCHTSHRKSAEINYCYDTCHHTETFESCYTCHDHR